MPRYLHIPHTPDTARKMMTGGRKYLTVSGITTPPTHDLNYDKNGGDQGDAW